jgi:hypothetical protein
MKLSLFITTISVLLLNAPLLQAQSQNQAQAIQPVDANFVLVNAVNIDDENCPGVISMNPTSWADAGTPEFIRALYPMNTVRRLSSNDVNTKSWEVDLIDFAPNKLQITVTLTAPYEFTWSEVVPGGSSIPVCQQGEYQSNSAAM